MIPAKKNGEAKSVVDGQVTLISGARGDFFGKKNMLKQTQQFKKRPKTGKYDVRVTKLIGNLNQMQINKSP